MEVIRRIGIFVIAAQAVIHFAPADKYAKYMKLIVGIIILLQLLSPVYNILGHGEMDWSVQLSNIEEELKEGLYAEEISGTNRVNNDVIQSMEKEIKSKLNNSISDEIYSVIKVEIEISDSYDSDSYEKYEFSMLHVAVRKYLSDEEAESNGIDMEPDNAGIKVNEIGIEKISVPDIGAEVTGNDSSPSESVGDRQSETERLKEKFCSILGVEESYMEVSIYGAAE